MAYYFEKWFIRNYANGFVYLKNGDKYLDYLIEYKDRCYPLCNQFYKNDGLIKDNLVIRGNDLIHVPKKIEIKMGEILDDLRDTKTSS